MKTHLPPVLKLIICIYFHIFPIFKVSRAIFISQFKKKGRIIVSPWRWAGGVHSIVRSLIQRVFIRSSPNLVRSFI